MQVEALPREWRCHMLASLYIVRSDETLSRVNPVGGGFRPLKSLNSWWNVCTWSPGYRMLQITLENCWGIIKKQWERIVLFHRVVGILHVLWHTLHFYRLEEQRRETSVWPSVESGCAEHASNSQRAAAHTDDTLDRPPAAALLPHLQVKSRTMTSMTSKQIGHHGIQLIQLIQPKKWLVIAPRQIWLQRIGRSNGSQRAVWATLWAN